MEVCTVLCGFCSVAVIWVSGSAEELNSPNPVSLQLCLLAKCFKPAVPFLELDMMDICKENGAYDAKHFLCYYYYGGMIYTGLKNFERALYFFEQVPTVIRTTLSAFSLNWTLILD